MKIKEKVKKLEELDYKLTNCKPEERPAIKAERKKYYPATPYEAKLMGTLRCK